MSGEPTGRDVEGLLAEHRPGERDSDDLPTCSCGHGLGWAETWPHHVAVVLAPLIAQARREGADEAGERLEAHCPHRADEPHQCPNLLAAHDAANIARIGTALRGDTP